MRIVMLTDDASAINRRILLEGEALVDAGHEVILIARKDDKAPAAAKLGRLKVVWVEREYSFLGGAWSNHFQGQEPIRLRLPQRPGWSGASLRAVGARSSWALFNSDADDADEQFGEPWQSRAIARARKVPARLTARVFRSAFRAVRYLQGRADRLRSVLHLSRGTTGDLHPSPVSYDGIEMNEWERTLFYNALFLDPDVIHVHDLPQLLAGVRLKQMKGIPLVYDAHEVYPEIATLTRDEKANLRWKESLLVKHCDLRITVNPLCAAYMEACYGCEPFEVIMNATARPADFAPEKSTARLHEALGQPRDVKFLIYQGWIADVGRGLRQLVEAMPSIRPDIHLIMMGCGDAAQLSELAKAQNVSDRVHIMPPVPWDQLVSWSAAADAGIIPYQPVDFNHLVCSPNELFEFIAARLPIICNDLPFLRSVVGKEGFGLVRTMKTPRQIANAVNEALIPRQGSLRERVKRSNSAAQHGNGPSRARS